MAEQICRFAILILFYRMHARLGLQAGKHQECISHAHQMQLDMLIIALVLHLLKLACWTCTSAH